MSHSGPPEEFVSLRHLELGGRVGNYKIGQTAQAGPKGGHFTQSEGKINQYCSPTGGRDPGQLLTACPRQVVDMTSNDSVTSTNCTMECEEGQNPGQINTQVQDPMSNAENDGVVHSTWTIQRGTQLCNPGSAGSNTATDEDAEYSSAEDFSVGLDNGFVAVTGSDSDGTYSDSSNDNYEDCDDDNYDDDDDNDYISISPPRRI